MTDGKRKHYSLKITGRVQGVFFRHSAKRRAEALGLAGSVRNASDGSVRIEIEGDEAALNDFIAWCKQGPSQAEVTALDIEEKPLVGLSDFTIEHNA